MLLKLWSLHYNIKDIEFVCNLAIMNMYIDLFNGVFLSMIVGHGQNVLGCQSFYQPLFDTWGKKTTTLVSDMATHSSVLAWRIPGTGEPGGLPSMGLHRVGHNRSDLAAAAVSRSKVLST